MTPTITHSFTPAQWHPHARTLSRSGSTFKHQIRFSAKQPAPPIAQPSSTSNHDPPTHEHEQFPCRCSTPSVNKKLSLKNVAHDHSFPRSVECRWYPTKTKDVSSVTPVLSCRNERTSSPRTSHPSSRHRYIQFNLLFCSSTDLNLSAKLFALGKGRNAVPPRQKRLQNYSKQRRLTLGIGEAITFGTDKKKKSCTPQLVLVPPSPPAIVNRTTRLALARSSPCR